MAEKPTREELRNRVEQLQQIVRGYEQSIEELARYRNILSSTEDGIAFLDEEYRYVIVNDAYERYSGVDRQKFLGLTVAEYLGREVFEKHIKPNFDRCLRGEIINYQQWFDYPRLGRRYADVTYFPYRDGSNRVSGIIANTRDLTERKYAESEQHMLNILLEALQIKTNWRNLARKVTALMQEWSGCEAVAIRLQEGEDFPYFETRGFPRGFIEAEKRICSVNHKGEILRDGSGNPLLECMCGVVISGRCPSDTQLLTRNGSFWINSTSEFLEAADDDVSLQITRRHCHDAGYESVALVPLQAGNRRIGLLQFNDRRRGRFNESIIAQFERLAASLAMAFLKRDADLHLRESEERFKNLANNLPGSAYQFVLAKGGEQRFSFIGKGSRDLFGIAPEEALADPSAVFDCIPKEDTEKIQKAIRYSASSFTQYDVEHRIVSQSGEVKWVRAISTPRKLANGDMAWDGIIIDISRRKEVEETLRHSLDDIKLREQIGKLFLTSTDGNLYAEMLDILLERFSSEYGYIGYMDEDGSLICPSMTRRVWTECQMHEKSIRFPRDSWGGIWGKSLQEKISIMRNSGLQPPDKHVRLFNALVVPLLAGDDLVGQIALANCPGEYSQRDRQQLESLAGFIAPVLKIFQEKEKADRKLRTSVHKLEQTNVALNVILEKGKEDSRELSKAIRHNFETLVFPHFDTVTNSHSKDEILTILEIIKKNTETCLRSLHPPHHLAGLQLSPREMEVIHLIKAGKTSKEIAAILRISPRSVYFHRNNIRKKLNIQDTGKSLKSHLQELEI